MKRILALVLSLMMVLGMIGSAAAEVPAHKADLIICNAIDMTAADKMENSTVIGNQIWNLVYNGLVEYHPETNEVQLGLAESYEQLSDTEYVFKLKQGVKFHNGDEFTAKDVVHTYERQITMPAAASYASSIEKIEIIDDYTVKYILKAPSAVFLSNLAMTCGYIESKKAYEDNGNAFVNCGTGPYKFAEWVPSDRIVVEKFEDCWDKGAVADRIIMRIIPEGSARVIALQNGEVDIALEPPAIELAYIAEDPNCNLLQTTSCKLDYFSFNSQKEPFTNPDVRKALAMAVNKDEVIAAVLEGNGIPANNVVGFGTMTYSDDLEKVPYDVEAAKALLAEAGYADGFEFAVTLNGDTREAVAQVLQAQFAELGVTMTINNWDNATHRQHINSGEFDASVSAWSNAADPDVIIRNMFHSSMVGVNNRTWLADPEFDKVIDGLTMEFDNEARKAGYKALQQDLLLTCVMVPLYYETLSIGTGTQVEGLRMNTGGTHCYKYAYVAQ